MILEILGLHQAVQLCNVAVICSYGPAKVVSPEAIWYHPLGSLLICWHQLLNIQHPSSFCRSNSNSNPLKVWILLVNNLGHPMKDKMDTYDRSLTKVISIMWDKKRSILASMCARKIWAPLSSGTEICPLFWHWSPGVLPWQNSYQEA